MASVQFNLLPDVKMAYEQAQRSRNLIVSTAFLVAAGSFALFVIMLLAVDVVQKKQLSSATKNVTKYSNQLKGISNVNRILTVQNQLSTLVNLHTQKHISSRLFSYLPQVTPTSVHINQISVDFTANTMQLSGQADSQTSVNTFIDTLKFTNFTVGTDTTQKSAFSSVVETSFGLDNQGAQYSLSVNFDPTLFSNNLSDSTPKLVVPKLTSTRSVVEDPANLLFSGQPSKGTQ